MAFTLNQDRSDTGNYPVSYYAATQNPAPELSPLDGSCRADVAIVGGGYTGLSSAIHLAKRGYKVVLLEARKLGWGASGRNGGHLGSGQRKDQIALEKMLGNAAAHQLWQLAQEAKSVSRSLIAEYGIGQVFIGRLGESRMHTMIFGSVTAALIQTASVPVTVVP